MAAARRSIAVGDANKYGRGAVVRLAPAAAFAALVSDAPPPPVLTERFAAAGLAVTVA